MPKPAFDNGTARLSQSDGSSPMLAASCKLPAAAEVGTCRLGSASAGDAAALMIRFKRHLGNFDEAGAGHLRYSPPDFTQPRAVWVPRAPPAILLLQRTERALGVLL